ncbi:MAG: lasso peptide biosynthesis B2 protein [Pseudomonadota bacterium]
MIRRKLATLRHMGQRRRALLVEALMWLAAARLALLVFPFRRVARRLGEATAPHADGAAAAGVGGQQDAVLAQDIGWAVGRMAAHVPFKAVCLQQAIAARMMLRRRGIGSALHFGVAKGESPAKALEAHAWLDAAGTPVTGYPVAPRFIEIACFR